MKHSSFFVLLLWSGMALAQDKVKRLDSLFQTQFNYGQLNGNVLVASGGKVLYNHSFGDRDIARHLPNSEGTYFSMASISKPFTATAVLQLVEKGKCHLDDSFVTYFSEFPYPAITIRQLLSHTSGLPDKQDLFTDSLIRLQPDRVWQNSDIIPALRNFGKLRVAPGERWSYSNINYNLLAMLIEKLSKSSYTTYLSRHIFQPAGMQNAYVETSLAVVDNPNKAVDHALTAPYESELKPVTDLPEMRKWIYLLSGFTGHGGLVMTVSNLLKFDQALYNGKLLKPATLAIAFSPTVLNNGKYADASSTAGQASYGLGWFIMKDTSAGKIVFHTGRSPGRVNMFLRNITKRETVIVLDNAESEAIYTTATNGMKILDNQPQRLRKLSAALYYSKVLFKQGPDAASVKLIQLRTDSATYELDPGQMDFMAYAFLNTGHRQLALEVFKNNLLLFPAIWQVYNSYARALLQEGKRELASELYQQALKLNAKNEEALKALADFKVKD